MQAAGYFPRLEPSLRFIRSKSSHLQRFGPFLPVEFSGSISTHLLCVALSLALVLRWLVLVPDG